MRHARHATAILLFVFFLAENSAAICAELETARTAAALEENVEDSLESQNITMNFDSVPLKDILKIFSKQSGFSFVASEEIEAKRLSVYFENVPMKEALDSIISANNLKYHQKAGSKVIVFSPPVQIGDQAQPESRTETRVFRLKFMRLSTSPIDIGGKTAIEDLTKANQLGQTDAGSSGGGAGGMGIGAGPASEGTQKGVDRLVQTLLTKNGRLTIDLPTNSLIVTDIPEKIEQIAAVLSSLDVAPDQVLLEVHLVEVKKLDQTRVGISWGGSDGELGAFTGGSRTTPFPFSLNQTFKAQDNDATGSVLTLGTMSATNFRATLRAILSDTNTKILARPRVLTMNNEAANIKLITNTAIANTSSVSSADGLATATSNTAERSETGIVLKMTPQINDDDTVGLYVEPSITTVAASAFFPSTFLDPTTRAVKTLARVKDQETLVIGGLIDKNKETTVRKVPILGDIPLFGNAFKNTAGDETERELIIFITPHIYRGADVTQKKSAYQRDAAVKRMLDQFMEGEIKVAIEPYERNEDARKSVYLQDKKMIDASAKRAKVPEVSRQMSLALDSFGNDKTKTQAGTGKPLSK